jgi:hypothetical protein
MPDFRSQPKGIFIHHSATRDTASVSFDAIKRYHVETNNWDDIGYDYLIEYVQGVPMVFTGRGLQYMGAHARGFNDHIGICVVGNFDEEVLPKDKTMVLVRLVASLLILYPHLTVDDIHYHREVANKTCPGLDFPSRDFIRRAVGEMV